MSDLKPTKHYMFNGTLLGMFMEVVETASYKLYRFTSGTAIRPKESDGSEFQEE